MTPLKLGQVLTTRSGEQFAVIELTTAQDIGEPDVDPDFFIVVLLPVGADPNWDSVELTSDEFHSFCDEEGIRY